MTDRDQPISPSRRRMNRDLEVRGFTAFLGRSPDQADREDLRRFQHRVRTRGASAGNMNMAVSALHF